MTDPFSKESPIKTFAIPSKTERARTEMSLFSHILAAGANAGVQNANNNSNKPDHWIAGASKSQYRG